MLTRFNIAYEKLKIHDDQTLVSSDWQGWNRGILSELPGATDFNYIFVPSILNTMYGSPSVIVDLIVPKLRDMLMGREDADDILASIVPTASGGAGHIMFDDNVTSPDLLNKLYQWLRFTDACSIDDSNIRSIVEFGSGYGALALVLKRMLPGITYTIVETPVVGAVAYQYLQDSLRETVHISTESIVPTCVNIVPTSKMDIIKNADVFISQGALCEAPDSVVDKVISTGWFGAKSGMLIIWEHAKILAGLKVNSKAVNIQPFDEWKGQNFVFFTQAAKTRSRKPKQQGGAQ